MKTFGLAALLVALGAGRSLAQGTLWDEAVHGSLGNSPETVTSLGSLALGTNSIFGRVEATPSQFGWTGTNDYFAFNIPNGFQVDAVHLTVNQQFLAWLGTSDLGGEIGHRYTAATENLLPFFGGQPLTAGTFGMYTSNNDLQSFSTSVNYRLDFVLTAVPEPGTWALLGLGGALLWSATRRRRK